MLYDRDRVSEEGTSVINCDLTSAVRWVWGLGWSFSMAWTTPSRRNAKKSVIDSLPCVLMEDCSTIYNQND